MMISVIPAVDLLIDLIPQDWVFLAERKVAPTRGTVNVIRMRWCERALFICGLVACSAGSFEGVKESGIEVEIFLCVENVATIMTTVPVLAFLCRCSQVCTPLTTMVVSCVVCVASVLSSISLVIDERSAETVSTACCVLIDIAAGIFFLIVCVSLVQSLQAYAKSSVVSSLFLSCCFLPLVLSHFFVSFAFSIAHNHAFNLFNLSLHHEP